MLHFSFQRGRTQDRLLWCLVLFVLLFVPFANAQAIALRESCSVFFVCTSFPLIPCIPVGVWGGRASHGRRAFLDDARCSQAAALLSSFALISALVVMHVSHFQAGCSPRPSNDVLCSFWNLFFVVRFWHCSPLQYTNECLP